MTFIDTKVKHRGKVSLRFQNFKKNKYGHGRIMQTIQVEPWHCYRFSCWVRTKGPKSDAPVSLYCLDQDERSLGSAQFSGPEAEWEKLTLGFNSMDNSEVYLYAGIWGGTTGKFWIDDLEVEEVGLLNVLRREGTPVTVCDSETGLVYREGKDYDDIIDPEMDFNFDHASPAIEILPGSRITDGQELAVSYWHGLSLGNGQVSLCMANKDVYKAMKKAMAALDDVVAADKYLLSMDEIRMGGTCQSCQDSGMSMAEILGECINRETEILKDINPDADVFIWSDMLDPNHNAVEDYYLVDGDYTGVWDLIPKDTKVMCWYYEKRQASLEHFSSHGFETMAAAYYDENSLENTKGWIRATEGMEGNLGIMYTTWVNDYKWLADFGDLVSEEE